MPISHSTHHATTHSMLDMTRTDWKRKGPRTTPHVRWHGLKTMGFSLMFAHLIFFVVLVEYSRVKGFSNCISKRGRPFPFLSQRPMKTL